MVMTNMNVLNIPVIGKAMLALDYHLDIGHHLLNRIHLHQHREQDHHSPSALNFLFFWAVVV